MPFSSPTLLLVMVVSVPLLVLILSTASLVQTVAAALAARLPPGLQTPLARVHRSQLARPRRSTISYVVPSSCHQWGVQTLGLAVE